MVSVYAWSLRWVWLIPRLRRGRSGLEVDRRMPKSPQSTFLSPRTGRDFHPAAVRFGDGARVYGEQCGDCHGAEGVEGPYDRLVGGQKPTKTIGSYWPYATTVFDYVRRTMPFDAPGSLSNEEVYAVTAWLLWKNNIIPADAVIDRTTLPKVMMPNRNAFIGDPRPDVP